MCIRIILNLFNNCQKFQNVPKRKMTEMEDDQNRRQPKWKTTKMEDDQNGRRQNGRRPKMKMTITKGRD